MDSSPGRSLPSPTACPPVPLPSWSSHASAWTDAGMIASATTCPGPSPTMAAAILRAAAESGEPSHATSTRRNGPPAHPVVTVAAAWRRNHRASLSGPDPAARQHRATHCDPGPAQRQGPDGNEVPADGTRPIVVSGANQGGKSTFLRSVAIAQLDDATRQVQPGSQPGRAGCGRLRCWWPAPGSGRVPARSATAVYGPGSRQDQGRIAVPAAGQAGLPGPEARAHGGHHELLRRLHL